MTSPKVQYLYLVGSLTPDNRLDLLATFLTDDGRDSREDADSPLSAELYDASGRLLLRFRIPAGRSGLDGRSVRLAVRGRLPFPPATRVVRFFRDAVLIHEMQVSDAKPRATLTWEPTQTVTGLHIINWQAMHPEGKPLQFFLRYSQNDGKSWQPASFPTADTSRALDFNQLPGGDRCRIMVVVTDGVNTVTAESRSFSVPIKPCQAMIFSPRDGSHLSPDQSVTLHGQGFYLEETRPETESLIWASSIDGELGKGMIVEVQRLSAGSHQITLIAGNEQRVGRAAVSIQVGREKY